MSAELLLAIVNLVLSAAALLYGVRLVRLSAGGLGEGWKWLVWGLGLFSAANVEHLVETAAQQADRLFQITGLIGLLEFGFIALFTVGIVVQLSGFRRLLKPEANGRRT